MHTGDDDACDEDDDSVSFAHVFLSSARSASRNMRSPAPLCERCTTSGSPAASKFLSRWRWRSPGAARRGAVAGRSYSAIVAFQWSIPADATAMASGSAPIGK